MRFPRIRRFAALTPTSERLLAWALYAVLTLWMIPHLEQKPSICFDVKTVAPSVVREQGIPKMPMYSLRTLITLVESSLGNLNTLSQLLYLSTIAR